MNGAVIGELLKLRPFRRFVLVTVSGHEYEIQQPQNCRVLGEAETLVWSHEGTTDFVDLKLIERIRMDDDFGFAEVEQIWK